MISTVEKINNKSKADLDNLMSSIYLLPQWEKIKEFSLQQRKFFLRRAFNAELYRKFSSKNMLEKYSLRLSDGSVLGSMDLKVYKDSVYIINLEIFSFSTFEQVVSKLVQVAVEKSLYNTIEKEVKVNFSYSLFKQTKMRKLLSTLGFVEEPEQSKYEKELFGETFTLNAQTSSLWQKEIKQFPVLINK